VYKKPKQTWHIQVHFEENSRHVTGPWWIKQPWVKRSWQCPPKHLWRTSPFCHLVSGLRAASVLLGKLFFCVGARRDVDNENMMMMMMMMMMMVMMVMMMIC